MPIDRLVLILVIVIATGAATLWLGALVATTFVVPLTWLALLPLALMVYIGWRVIADRVGNAEDDHYDGMK
ncbi:MAG: hypothetical protein AAFY65_00930 [Pseudomonadota bacterium]